MPSRTLLLTLLHSNLAHPLYKRSDSESQKNATAIIGFAIGAILASAVVYITAHIIYYIYKNENFMDAWHVTAIRDLRTDGYRREDMVYVYTVEAVRDVGEREGDVCAGSSDGGETVYDEESGMDEDTEVDNNTHI